MVSCFLVRERFDFLKFKIAMFQRIFSPPPPLFFYTFCWKKCNFVFSVHFKCCKVFVTYDDADIWNVLALKRSHLKILNQSNHQLQSTNANISTGLKKTKEKKHPWNRSLEEFNLISLGFHPWPDMFHDNKVRIWVKLRD